MDSSPIDEKSHSDELQNPFFKWFELNYQIWQGLKFPDPDTLFNYTSTQEFFKKQANHFIFNNYKAIEYWQQCLLLMETVALSLGNQMNKNSSTVLKMTPAQTGLDIQSVINPQIESLNPAQMASHIIESMLETMSKPLSGNENSSKH